MKAIKCLCLGFLLFFAVAQSVNAGSKLWVGPVNGYLNLFNGNTNIDSEPVEILFPNGNPPGKLEVQDNLIVTFKPEVDVQSLRVSLDGITWFEVTLVGAAYQHDFGQLALGEYQLYISVDGQMLSPKSFSVIDTIVPPGEVNLLISANGGVGQTYTRVWEEVEGADYYRILVMLGDGSETIVEEHNHIVGTSYTLSHDTAGYYWVYTQACNRAGCGPYATDIMTVRENVLAWQGNIQVPDTAYVGQSVRIEYPDVPGAKSYSASIPNVDISKVTTTYAASNTQFVSIYEPGTYYVYMRACNDSGCGAPSEVKALTVLPNPTDGLGVPPQVSNFQGYVDEVVEANWWFEVVWDEVAEADSYNIIRWYNDYSEFELIEAVTGNKDYINLTQQGEAEVRIQSCNNDVCSDWSGKITLTVGPDLPNPVTQIDGPAEVAIDEPIIISWQNAYNADRYTIRRNGSGIETTSGHCSINATYNRCTTYAHSTSSDLLFSISACNDNGCISSTASHQVKVIQVLPNPINEISGPATASVNETFELSWQKPNLAEYFNVYLADQLVASPVEAKFTAEHNAEGSYQYSIYSCNSHGCNSTPALHTVTVETALPDPIVDILGPERVAVDETFELSWQKPDLAEHFDIYVNSEFTKNTDELNFTSNHDTIGTYEYSIYSCNAHGCNSVPTQKKLLVSQQYISWEAVSVMAGQAVTLTWDVDGLSSCETSDGSFTTTSTSGTKELVFYSIGEVTFDCVDANDQPIPNNNKISVSKLPAPQNLQRN